MTGMTVFKLCDRHRSSVPAQGLSCDRGGIFLGDCALVAPITDTAGRRTYRARPLTEINYVLSAAYGREVDLSVRMPGLHQAAIYMTEGKWALAQVAALQLYVPELPDEEAVVRLRKAEALLRFNPYHRPAGTPDGGQFTSQDGTSGIVPVGAESSSGSETRNPLPKSETPYVAKNYVKYKKPVGSGECVPLVQVAAGVPKHTKWHEGAKLSDRPNIPEGTAIATFVDGKYPNAAHGNHAAIFIGYGTKNGQDGMYVYDQWSGKAPGKRFLPFDNASGGRSNNASAFSVIK